MPSMIKKTFPILVALGQKVAPAHTPPPLPPIEAAEFLHVILKTYKASIATTLSKHQQTRESIVPWGTLLFQVVGMQLPAGVTLPGDKDEWEKHAWWKAKKWALGTLNRLFERYIVDGEQSLCNTGLMFGGFTDTETHPILQER